jgi:hypothetical protein
LASAGERRWDEHGFLVPSPAFLSVHDLFRKPATLIVAPPWLGKTTFAKALSADDLLEVVKEELERIGPRAKDHLPLLYRPAEIGESARRRHEDALQADVACRLGDLLPGKVLVRESQVVFERRLDIKVISSVVGVADPVAVVIEVKWSDNSDPESGVSTALANQLGRKYMVEAGPKHGILLVGWNGKLGTWHADGPDRPAEDPQSLQVALEAEARSFEAANPGYRIEPVVLDLCWQEN